MEQDHLAESPVAEAPFTGIPGAGSAGEGEPGEIERRLAGIERALERLEDGSYWHCETCGVRLEASVLEADPARSRCEDHRDPAVARGPDEPRA